MLTMWGIVQAWITASEGRTLKMQTDRLGLCVVLDCPVLGNARERVKTDEDPSKAAMRAISRLGI